jgi:hypothetical protein
MAESLVIWIRRALRFAPAEDRFRARGSPSVKKIALQIAERIARR